MEVVEEVDAFSVFSNELYAEIFGYLDWPAVRAARLVSFRWNAVIDYSRPLEFSCRLTDDTFGAVIQSTLTFPKVIISDFTGGAAGYENIITSQVVALVGDNVRGEATKILLHYATETLKELSLEQCHWTTLKFGLATRKPFEQLKKLSLKYEEFPSLQDTESVAKLVARPSTLLPVLEHFKVSYELREPVAQNAFSQKYLFNSYFAIVQAIVNHRRTLKKVEITRNVAMYRSTELLNGPYLYLTQPRRDKIQQCLNAFRQDFDLDMLRVSPLYEEGILHPYTLEMSMIREPQRLKELALEIPYMLFAHRLQPIAQFLPANLTTLTTIKILINDTDIRRHFPIQGQPFDLLPISQCVNLKTLWVNWHSRVVAAALNQHTTSLANLQTLPKTLTQVHFETSREGLPFVHQQIILDVTDLLWIAANWLELEELWLQAMVPEQAQNEIDPAEQHVNFSLTILDLLLEMPKLARLNLDMFKGTQLDTVMGRDGNPHLAAPRIPPISAEEIQQYVEECRGKENANFVGVTVTATEKNWLVPYYELKVKRNARKGGDEFDN